MRWYVKAAAARLACAGLVIRDNSIMLCGPSGAEGEAESTESLVVLYSTVRWNAICDNSVSCVM